MTSDELKNIQKPLKDKYRENPEAALVTLKANSTVGEGISCKVDTGKALAQAGLHPATGGDGSELCSGDMLLEALAACMGVTIKAVGTALDFQMDEARVEVEGDLDFRGTLAVDKEAPVGFKAIRVKIHLTTSENEERTASLLKLSERYCVVYQTLAHANQLSLSRA
ncbi:MAG: OsmC family protein [Cyclobacteriaceae bacterium]